MTRASDVAKLPVLLSVYYNTKRAPVTGDRGTTNVFAGPRVAYTSPGGAAPRVEEKADSGGQPLRTLEKLDMNKSDDTGRRG